MATVQDWSNNIVGTYKFKDGKTYLLSKTNSNSYARSTCYYLNYYNCPPDYGGNFANCDYLGSELLGCGDETTIQCNGECGGNIDIVADSFYTDNPKRYVALGFYGAWKVEGVALLKGYKFFSDSEKNYFTSVPKVNSKLVMLNSGIPNATYSSSISIGEWVIPNTSVRSRIEGTVLCPTLGVHDVNHKLYYIAKNDL